MSGRVSYVFGFSGPSMTIDTACSSSMVSIFHACRALVAGDCRAAVAGGVNVITSPDVGDDICLWRLQQRSLRYHRCILVSIVHIF